MFIKNDRHGEFCMLVVGLTIYRPILRVSVVERPREEASTSTSPLSLPPFIYNNSMKDEDMMGDQVMAIDVNDDPNVEEEE